MLESAHPYADLEIRILERQEAGYPVEITLNGVQHFSCGFLAADVLSWISGGNAQADGERLFAMLLGDGLARDAWARVRGQYPQCRVRLRLDTTVPELHALPWELLHDGQTFLAAHTDTPFSRYLALNIPPGDRIIERPIRVLAALSNPADLSQPQYNLAPLDVPAERARLEALWRDLPVEPVFLEPPVTPERLEAALREQRPHILHLMAHGTFNQRHDWAALYLQDDAGDAALIQDADFASIFDRLGQDRPRLVFLAACESAARSTVDAFAGLSPKLVLAGVPAVVAMQDRVAITATQKLTLVFYADLFRHGEVDRALNAARSLLLTGQLPDAGAPMLLMRLQDGKLWDTVHTVTTARRDFYAHAPRLDPERYVNRPHEYDQIKALLLADTATVGITTALRGAGGFGKTTLARALCDDADIQARFSDGVLWATLGETPDVPARLREWVTVLGGVISENAPTIPQLVNHLTDLLRDGAYLLLIDDVWDAAALQPFLCGGPHCVHLVTTRSRTTLPVAAQTVNVDAMQAAEAVAALIYGLDVTVNLSEATAFRALAQRLGHWPLLLGIINGVLRESCAQGAALVDALMYVIKGLDEEGLTAFDAADATDRARAVRATMEVSLNYLTSIDRVRYTELAIFPEDTDIPATAAARLWGQTGDLSVFKTKDLFRRLAAASLVQIYDAGRQTVRLHDVVRVYLSETLGDAGCVVAHRALLEAYRATQTDAGWHTAPDDGYLYAHLTYHLDALAATDADAVADLAALFATDAWLQARVTDANYIYDSYLVDVEYAWRRAEEQVKTGNVHALVECVRYALIRTTVNSLSSNYLPELVVRAVETGLWTSEQGLSVTRHMPDLQKRAKTVTLLLKSQVLDTQQRIEAQQLGLIAVRAIEPWERSKHLAALFPYLEGHYLSEVLTVALELESAEHRAEALAMLAPYLRGDEKACALSGGLAAMRAITWEVSRVKALALLMPHLGPQSRLAVAVEGLTVVRGIENDTNRADALAALAPHLERELVMEVLVIVQQFCYGGYQSQVLSALAPRLTKDALTKALEMADKLWDEQKYINFLVSLVPYMETEKRHQIIDNILGLLQGYVSPEDRVEILSLLVPYMRSQERESVLTIELASAIAMKAAETEWEEETTWYRANILATLIPHLEAEQKRLALTEAFRSIQSILFEESRAKLLVMLSSYLEGILVAKGLAIVQGITDEHWKAVALAALATKLEGDLLISVMPSHLSDKDLMEEAATRLLGARKIATENLIRRELIEEIGWDSKAVESARQLIKRALCLKSAEQTQVLMEGLEWGLAIEDKMDRVRVLATIVPHLRRAERAQVLTRALATTREISSDVEREEALYALIPCLEDHQLGEVLRLTLEIVDKEMQARTLLKLIPRLKGSVRRQALVEGLAAVKQILERRPRMGFMQSSYSYYNELIADFVPYLDGDLLTEGVAVVLKIGGAYSRAQALAILAFQIQVKPITNMQDTLRKIRSALLECLWASRELERRDLLYFLTENGGAFLHAFDLPRAAWINIAAAIIDVGRWSWL